MNDSMSILLATTILALGGLGLYMYKTTDESEVKDGKDGSEEDYNEDSIFGKNFWGSKQEDTEENLEEEYLEEDDFKPRKRGGKTLKNKKASGSSRRRY
jgi:hypothetical protein